MNLFEVTQKLFYQKKFLEIFFSKICSNFKLSMLYIEYRALDDVHPTLIEKFRQGAEAVLKNKDAVSALAAALAVISGNTKISNRSLLSSREVSLNFALDHIGSH